MDLLYLFILAALALFTLFISYRYYVFKVGFANYFSFCISYTALMNKHASFLKEVVKVWPMRLWLWDLSNWSLDKYIINQDMYQEMLVDMEKEAVKILKKLEDIIEKGDAQRAADRAVTPEDMLAAMDKPGVDLSVPPAAPPASAADLVATVSSTPIDSPSEKND